MYRDKYRYPAMTKYDSFYLILAISFLTSCDPDVAGEGIDLPAMKFAFKVSPDTAYLHEGDTLILKSSMSSMLTNGLKVKDGSAILKVALWRYNNIPATTTDSSGYAIAGEDFLLISDEGDVKYQANGPGCISEFTCMPVNDSLKVKYRFVFIKKGLYQFNMYSSFYEGSLGKTRTSGYFDAANPHWDFIQIPGQPQPDPNYKQGYVIGVVN
jgi:hypothetical protein